tara:strand:- start:156 stop:365 length:210 start_codon:yes stop_codon:yes gene_type:complete
VEFLTLLFFFSDKKMTVAQWHKAKMALLVLILLTKVCARGVGTAWHSILLGARDPFWFFKNFFAQKSHL